ncbi:MAG: DUF1573 domain-containing protein [Thermoguttaceae bacterium]
MRTWPVVVLAAVLGVGAGFGLTALRIKSAPWDGTAAGSRLTPSTPPPASGVFGNRPVPKVEVDHDSYDFGVMDSLLKGSHVFQFKNAGRALLTLTKGPTSCRCTVAQMEKAELQPGESAGVTLEWTAKTSEGPYRESVVIETNDPERPRVTLTVHGEVTTAIQVNPSELVFSALSPEQSAVGTVNLLGRLPEPFAIEGHELVDPKFAGCYEVTIEPLKGAELAAEKAQSGYALHVKIKPGLPTGAFRQVIRVKTNVKTVPTIDIPVKGSIVSDEVLILGGKDWAPQASLLSIETVDNRKDTVQELTILVRGSYCDKVKFEIVEVWPALLQVEIGQTVQTPNKSESRTPLIIRIPKNSPPANHLGSEQGKLGRILLRTNHPSASTLLVRVRFAIEG